MKSQEKQQCVRAYVCMCVCVCSLILGDLDILSTFWVLSLHHIGVLSSAVSPASPSTPVLQQNCKQSMRNYPLSSTDSTGPGQRWQQGDKPIMISWAAVFLCFLNLKRFKNKLH